MRKGDLSAQMPLIIKGVYFDGWDPSATPVKARTKAEFLALVNLRTDRGVPSAVAALGRVRAHHLAPGTEPALVIVRKA